MFPVYIVFLVYLLYLHKWVYRQNVIYADIGKINRPLKQETPVNVEKNIFLGDIKMSVGTANKEMHHVLLKLDNEEVKNMGTWTQPNAERKIYANLKGKENMLKLVYSKKQD